MGTTTVSAATLRAYQMQQRRRLRDGRGGEGGGRQPLDSAGPRRRLLRPADLARLLLRLLLPAVLLLLPQPVREAQDQQRRRRSRRRPPLDVQRRRRGRQRRRRPPQRVRRQHEPHHVQAGLAGQAQRPLVRGIAEVSSRICCRYGRWQSSLQISRRQRQLGDGKRGAGTSRRQRQRDNPALGPRADCCTSTFRRLHLHWQRRRKRQAAPFPSSATMRSTRRRRPMRTTTVRACASLNRTASIGLLPLADRRPTLPSDDEGLLASGR